MRLGPGSKRWRSRGIRFLHHLQTILGRSDRLSRQTVFVHYKFVGASNRMANAAPKGVACSIPPFGYENERCRHRSLLWSPSLDRLAIMSNTRGGLACRCGDEKRAPVFGVRYRACMLVDPYDPIRGHRLEQNRVRWLASFRAPRHLQIARRFKSLGGRNSRTQPLDRCRIDRWRSQCLFLVCGFILGIHSQPDDPPLCASAVSRPCRRYRRHRVRAPCREDLAGPVAASAARRRDRAGRGRHSTSKHRS